MSVSLHRTSQKYFYFLIAYILVGQGFISIFNQGMLSKARLIPVSEMSLRHKSFLAEKQRLYILIHWYILGVSQVYLRFILGISLVYLWYILGVSQVYLRYILGISLVYIRYILSISLVYLRYILCISLVYLRFILGTSLVYIRYISGIS